MEFPQGRRDGKYLEEEGERKQRGAGGQQAFPLASSSSSPILVHWADGCAEPSSSAPPPPAPAGAAVEKEHMFEKVVTPSDVGKLNRLVIPKQHAEKYFPLDASSNDKGLLLNFEDRSGKPWRFRYSYWNSSQSYVMTKGWSRFVKEKQLDAGDTVSFARGVPDHARDRLFIDCKRRPDPRFDPNPPASLRIPRFAYHPYPFSAAAARSSANSWGPASRLFAPHAPATVTPASNYFYFRSPAAHPDRAPPVPMVLDSFPVAHAKAAAAPKRVRLFGVNLEQACDAGDTADTSTLLLLHRRPPLPSPELRLGANGGARSSSSSSSSREWKDAHHSPPLDLDMC